TVDYQGRTADGRKDPPDINLGVHSRKRHGGAGTGSHAQIGRPPIPEAAIERHAGGPFLDPHRPAPVLLNLAAITVALFAGGAPGVIDIPKTACIGPEHS